MKKKDLMCTGVACLYRDNCLRYDGNKESDKPYFISTPWKIIEGQFVCSKFIDKEPLKK